MGQGACRGCRKGQTGRETQREARIPPPHTHPTPREAPRGRHPSYPSLPAPGLPESRRWACALSLQCPLAVCLATHVLDKCVRTEQQERTKQRTLSWLRRSPQSRPVPTSGLPTSNSKINAHRGARQDVASRLLTPRLPAPAALPGAGQERNCRSQSPAHAVTSPGRLEGHPQRAALARFTGR